MRSEKPSASTPPGVAVLDQRMPELDGIAAARAVVSLPSQRVRIESAGGKLDIHSTPGAGTRVETRVPA